jgi:glycosyltransferase involved in cell wall biosynthesis
MVSQPGDAGVAHVVADYVRWLVAAGWAVTVACDPESRLADLVQDNGGSTRPWVATREPGPSLAPEFRNLRRLLVETDPTLVHLHSSKAGLVGRLMLRGGLPTIFQPHAWSFEATTSLKTALARRWERHASRWSDLTICVSEAERKEGAAAGVHSATAVLPNAVDLRRFHPPDDRAARRDESLDRLGLPAGTPLAVCLGRLCRQKGQDLLLAAWPRVLEQVPDAVLVVVGDGPDRARLSLSAGPQVRFIGALKDPVPWLQAADVVAVPSRWEGQALTILEAMACAAPVVASDIAANAETLGRSAGALVDVHDPGQLAHALIERLSPSNRRQLVSEGRRGRERVVAHHDPDRIAARLVELYDLATGRAREPHR